MSKNVLDKINTDSAAVVIFVVTVVGHVVIFLFYWAVVENKSERKKTKQAEGRFMHG